MPFKTPLQRPESYKSKVSSTDTTADYLINKFVAGSGITISKLNAGSNEQLEIASSVNPNVFLRTDQTTPQETVGAFNFSRLNVNQLGQLDGAPGIQVLNYLEGNGGLTDIINFRIGGFNSLNQDGRGNTLWGVDSNGFGTFVKLNATGLYSKSFVVSFPFTTTTKSVLRIPNDITITAVHIQCTDGTSIVGNLDELDSNGVGTPVPVGADLTVSAGTNVDSTTFTNADIDAGDYLGFHFTSVTGAVSKVEFSFEYTLR